LERAIGAAETRGAAVLVKAWRQARKNQRNGEQQPESTAEAAHGATIVEEGQPAVKILIGVHSIDFRMHSRREATMAETHAADVHPPYLYPDYKSTRLRAPSQPLVRVGPSPLETTGPAFPREFVKESEADLTTWGRTTPLGERMVLVGRVLDEGGRPVRRSLVEVWQANASGRYPHPVDDHDAPLDP